MPGAAVARERARVVKKCLLKHGVPEVSIELQAGRPSDGDDWNALQPVALLSHHTASHPTVANPVPTLFVVKHGRPDLPGPLANGTAGVDLVYRILTLGFANHSGEGGPFTFSGPLGAYTIPKDVGRPYLWGTEYEGGFDEATWDNHYTNRRTGKRMTFREFMGRANAGLAEAIWLINGKGKKPTDNMDLSTYHGEHSTWAPKRKIDRLHYSTTSGRQELRKYAKDIVTPTYPPNTPGVPRVVLSNVVKAARGKIDYPTPSVRRVQATLNELYPGTDIKLDGTWGSKVTRAYKHHQASIGSAPEFQDGIPGLKDLQALGGHHWTVITK